MKKYFFIALSLFLLVITSVSAVVFFSTNVTEEGNHQIIRIAPNQAIVFSLSKIIDRIEFNKDSGFTIRTLD
jgi:uncharacterized membrane protein